LANELKNSRRDLRRNPPFLAGPCQALLKNITNEKGDFPSVFLPLVLTFRAQPGYALDAGQAGKPRAMAQRPKLSGSRCPMHESSIALSLLEIIEERCREEGCKSVESVRVRAGKASGVSSESLSFAFEILKKDTIAHEAKLIIDLVPLGGLCSRCENQFTTEEAYILECPHCSSTSFKINQGYELEFVEMEVN
jgi:hydrogenase nickel incorporation protein HypA/HybF